MDLSVPKMTLLDYLPPVIMIPFAVIMVAVLLFLLWTYVLKDHVWPRIDTYIATQQRISRRKKYLVEMQNASYAGLEATLEMFSNSGPRHVKMREPGRRTPRHSTLVS